MILAKQSIKACFILTNFYDLMPLAFEIAEELGYSRDEISGAIIKTYNKSCDYPPLYNRTAWFRTVFKEKLREYRSDLLAHKADFKL